MTEKEAKNLVEGHLYTYREDALKAKESGRNKAHEWLAGGVARLSSPTHRNGTEEAVIKLVSDIEELSRWCMVFEKTYERFRFDPKADFIRAVYLRGLSVPQACDAVVISERTFYLWRREVLEIACRWAAELNLIDYGEKTWKILKY